MSETMTTYRVHFDRIGRAYRDQTETFEATDVDHLAEQIHGFARKHLGSRYFEVSVDLSDGKVWIEHGRFGAGTVAAGSATAGEDGTVRP